MYSEELDNDLAIAYVAQDVDVAQDVAVQQLLNSMVNMNLLPETKRKQHWSHNKWTSDYLLELYSYPQFCG